MLVRLLKLIGKVEKFNKWVPHELAANQNQKKKNHFEVSSLILCNNKEPFLNRIVTCDKSGFYTTPSNGHQLSAWEVLWSFFFLQSQTCTTEKVMVTLWSAAGLIHYSLLNLAKPLHLRGMLSKLLRCTKNCKACSQQWSTEWARFFSMTIPDHMLYNQCFKSWTNWATKFCLICYIHLTSRQLTATSSGILKTCKMLLQPAGIRNCFPRICQIPKHGFLCYRNKQTFLVAKSVLIVMVPILINKGVFEPSYNLKFMV